MRNRTFKWLLRAVLIVVLICLGYLVIRATLLWLALQGVDSADNSWTYGASARPDFFSVHGNIPAWSLAFLISVVIFAAAAGVVAITKKITSPEKKRRAHPQR